jgi:hypothetical protein
MPILQEAPQEVEISMVRESQLENVIEMMECWEYTCPCGHTTYFVIGGGADIICHSCWNYGVTYRGKMWITRVEWRKSMWPGRKDE